MYLNIVCRPTWGPNLGKGARLILVRCQRLEGEKKELEGLLS